MSRQFVEKHYFNLKLLNPELPFLVRDGVGAPARMFARYGKILSFCCSTSGWFLLWFIDEHLYQFIDSSRLDWGQEKEINLHNKSEEECLEALKELQQTGRYMRKSQESEPFDVDVVDATAHYYKVY